ncbi:hypothetical protein HYW20_09155 [Candidatus Woesearchaeota archaeon]|nr:hypothetical protein [Candidatus Woesearchaeota archaeon]
MLDEKRIKQIENRVKNFLSDGTIQKTKNAEYVDFFLESARKSLQSASLLHAGTTKKELQEAYGFEDFDGSLWIINASYYSMFYMARALLANEGIKLKGDLSIHLVTFDSLVYFFYLTGKLQKKIIEDFAEAKDEAAEILGQEKAKGLIEDYYYERKKRSDFTYEMGMTAMLNKAQTSLERARKFNEEVRKIIKIR